MKLAIEPHQGSGIKRAQLQGRIVENALRFRIGGKQDLKAAIQQEAVSCMGTC